MQRYFHAQHTCPYLILYVYIYLQAFCNWRLRYRNKSSNVLRYNISTYHHPNTVQICICTLSSSGNSVKDKMARFLFLWSLSGKEENKMSELAGGKDSGCSFHLSSSTTNSAPNTCCCLMFRCFFFKKMLHTDLQLNTVEYDLFN